MTERRYTRRYCSKTGSTMWHAGIAGALDRREREQRLKWLSGRIHRGSSFTTLEAARKWEERQVRVSRERRRKAHKGR